MKINFEHMGISAFEEKIIIPTYITGAESETPPLFMKGVRNVYPYKFQNSFTDEIVEKEYQVIKLKSEHIELSILPDWGCHLYRAVDLKTGRDMFHCPKVMKPANNAIRGAYVAGGVEFNFPIGHNAMTWSRTGLSVLPVEDGISAFFYHIDRSSGLEMTAGVTLVNGFRGILFEQYFCNRTETAKPWYNWLNAGIAPDKSLRFVFPDKKMLGHFEGPFLETKKEYSYPSHDGFDYSDNTEIPEPVGLFSFGNVGGWFGAWYERLNFGIARWAAPWQVGGRKFWSWGNSPEGLLWGKIAADQDLPVPEIQSGRPEIQMDRGIMLPYSETSHKEWWIPLDETEGFNTVSRFGAMNLIKKPDAASVVKISPSVRIESCMLEVNAEIVAENINAEAGAVIELEIPSEMDIEETISLKDKNGSLLDWKRNSELKAPANTIYLLDSSKAVSSMTAVEIARKGFKHERMIRPDLAEKFYSLALGKDPDCTLALQRQGFRHLQKEQNHDALKLFKRVLELDRSNDEALYMHGIASLRTGEKEQAKSDFEHCAATGCKYRIASIIQLAFIAFRDREYHKFEMLIDDALEDAPANSVLLLLKAIDFRRREEKDKAVSILSHLSSLRSQSPLIRQEKDFIRVDSASMLLPAEGETEDSVMISTALFYAKLGLMDDAERILKKCSSDTGQSEAAYLLEYWKRKNVFEKSGFFAWGRETMLALEDASNRNPSDSSALYSLACLYAAEGRLADAIEKLEFSGSVNANDPRTNYLLGKIYIENGEKQKAEKALRKALEKDKENPDILIELANAVEEKKELAALFSDAPESFSKNDSFRACFAEVLLERGEYDKAAAMLHEHVFHPYELLHDLRNLRSLIFRKKAVEEARNKNYKAALASIEKALEYPENLALAEPLRKYDAKTLFTGGLIAEAALLTDSARNYYRHAAEEYPPDPTPVKAWSGAAMLKLGEKDRAEKTLSEISEQAEKYLQSEIQADLNEDFKNIKELCTKIKNGNIPKLEEMN